MSEIQGGSYQPPLEESQSDTQPSATAPAKTKPMFNVFGAKPVIDAATGDFKNRFPAMRVIASCIRSLTAGLSSVGSAIKDVAWSTYSKLKVSVAQLSVNSTNIAAIKTLYGEEMASTYTQAFLEHGKIKQESSEQIKSDFEKLPPQEETITLLSKGVISVSEMGYYTNPEGLGLELAPDALIPKDGFARIYGEAERIAMLGTLNDEHQPNEVTILVAQTKKAIKEKITLLEALVKKNPEFQSKLEGLQQDTHNYQNWQPYQLLAYGKAQSLDWGRVRLKVLNGNVIFPKAEFTPTENLNAFKNVIQLVANNTVSDREAYEMMRLIDQEGLSGGFATGSNSKTGLAFGQERMTNIDENVVLITSGEDTSVRFNYTSAKAYVSSIIIPPSNDTSSPLTTAKLSELRDEDGGSLNINRTANQNIPQFELSMKYTYAYTPPATSGEKGNSSLVDSRVTCSPIQPFRDEAAGDASVARASQNSGRTTLESRSRSSTADSTWSMSSTLMNLSSIFGSSKKETEGTMPAKIQSEFEHQLNNPDKKVLVHAFADQKVGEEADASIVSFQFHRDLHAEHCLYFLKDASGTVRPLYVDQDLHSSEDGEERSKCQSTDSSKDFIDFIGNKDQALEVSRVANQAWLGILFTAMNTADGPFQLDKQGGIPALSSPTYTFSKPQEGKVIVHVAFKGAAKNFSFSAEGKYPVHLDSEKSSAEINYDMTLDFDPSDSKKPPRISVSPINYNYHFEKKVE